jgi:OmpA family/FecR protein
MKRFLRILDCLLFLVLMLVVGNSREIFSQEKSPVFDLRPGKKVVFKNNVFEQGSSTIALSQIGQFEQLLNFMKARPQLIFEINGYTDNIGDVQINERLSLARSESVKNYFLQRGIAEMRIKTHGRGADNPIATNETEEGRGQNRRIEVIALSSLTERPNTTGRNIALQPEGRITAILPSVLTLAPWDEVWQEARLGEQIYEYYRVQTVNKGRAEITFNNKQRVQVAENSVVMLYGSKVVSESEAQKGKPNEQIRLMQGSMFVKMKSLQKTQPILVRTANGEVAVALSETSAKIEMNAKQQFLVSVHEGNAQVQGASGAAISVPENFGTQVSTDTPPEKPRSLPSVPELLAPDLNDSLFAGMMKFSWKKQSPRVRFEIANDVTFQKPFHAVVFGQDSASVAMTEGDWYIRLAGIDEIGLESRSSIYRISVGKAAIPFRFYFLTMLMFVLAIGTSWWTWLIRKPRYYALALVFVGLGTASFFLLHW